MISCTKKKINLWWDVKVLHIIYNDNELAFLELSTEELMLMLTSLLNLKRRIPRVMIFRRKIVFDGGVKR
jgi:hypothetical protein